MKQIQISLVMAVILAFVCLPVRSQEPPPAPPAPVVAPVPPAPPAFPDDAFAPMPPIPPMPPVPAFDAIAPAFAIPPMPPMPLMGVIAPPALDTLGFQLYAMQDQRTRDAQQRAEERAREAEERVREREMRRGTRDREDSYYRQGSSYLDRREYEKAINAFDRVVEQKAGRVDGALYWRAYAQNKLGRRDDAIATLDELKKNYPSSRWLDDAKALE